MVGDDERRRLCLRGGGHLLGRRLECHEREARHERTGPEVQATPACRSPRHSAHSGSQWSVWNDGRPSGTGLSGNEIVRAPFSIARLASATHRSMSQTGRIASGMNRPGAVPHPLVDVEVVPRLHAHARPSFFVARAARNVPPPNPGNDGKAQRGLLAGPGPCPSPASGGVVAAGDHVPRSGPGPGPTDRRGLPATALSPIVGKTWARRSGHRVASR